MIIIIGAGLSGLLTAYRLKKKGVPFKILEARNRIGGRIYTLKGDSDTPIEMGATWFGNQHQLLIELLKELDLPYFEQYMEGTCFYQPDSTSPPKPFQIPKQDPSYRIKGGSISLINALRRGLNKNDILQNQKVQSIKLQSNSISIEANELFEAAATVITVPPKLLINSISFEPEIPSILSKAAKQTQTWMEDSIKVALVYDQPFWKNKNQSGALFSNPGPVSEFYDHSNSNGTRNALCGFVNSKYKNYTPEQRKKVILNHLISAFGKEVSDYREYHELIWSAEPNTFSLSETPHFPHQNNGNPIFSNTLYNGRLVLSGTEISSHYGGYMEGAIHSANEAINKLEYFKIC